MSPQQKQTSLSVSPPPIIPVVLCGGAGSRLWPLSRTHMPKQFLHLLGDHTLFQDTLARLKHIPKILSPIIISNLRHKNLVAEQMQQIGISATQIILEPIGRNTAPAIAIAAMRVLALYPEQDPLLLVLPADHAILNTAAFKDAVKAASECAAQGKLACFGVVPTRPETGYGYIKSGKNFHDNVYEIERFVEKPNLELAKQYLASEQYYWNSGMFMFSAHSYLQELKCYAKDIFHACEDVIANSEFDEGDGSLKLNVEKFSMCRSESIDYAVMEYTKDAVVVPFDAGWSDIGSWQAVWEHGKKDESSNVLVGDVISRGINNCYVQATKRKIVAIGLENCIIVETDDAVLVVHKDKCQDIKQIIHN